MKLGVLVLVLFIGGCAPESKTSWNDNAVVLSVSIAGGHSWGESGPYYIATFEEDGSHVIYQVSELNGPPPIWAGLHISFTMIHTMNEAGTSYNTLARIRRLP